MATEAISSSEPVYAAGRHGPLVDEFWMALVGAVDALLRFYHGIYEFTDDPDCVLRVAAKRARNRVSLFDGTRVESGERVGSLHLWNEHLPRYSERGPDVGWACEMRRRVLRSTQLLADYVEREQAWHQVSAFCAETTLSNRLGDAQIRRLAARHGFERVEPRVSMLRRLHAIGDSFNTRALTRAFNPAALSRQPFLRGRSELWISRAALLGRYGCPAQNKAETIAPHYACSPRVKLSQVQHWSRRQLEWSRNAMDDAEAAAILFRYMFARAWFSSPLLKSCFDQAGSAATATTRMAGPSRGRRQR
jgi:hypothetical protein